jgi:hypothetical protein
VEKVSDPTTRMLQVEIPATLDPMLEKFVVRFARKLAKDLHSAERIFSHHDVVLDLNGEGHA